ncbi:DUF6701 domain-containing protein [Pseudidiomarina sp. WS423]|uniref:DUF6701 domain-containing protein n=1 Tax=Pseudidiomarina sp. WS423 TaxID=3425124 RepID=UPI003D702069
MVLSKLIRISFALLLFAGVSNAYAERFDLPNELDDLNDEVGNICSISGNTITCNGNVTLPTGDDIRVNGSLNLIVNGNLTLNGNNEVNVDDSPNDLNIQVSGQFTANNNSDINANITAQGNVVFNGNNEVEGDITSNNGEIRLNSNADVEGDLNAPNGPIILNGDNEVIGNVSAGQTITLNNEAEIEGNVSSGQNIVLNSSNFVEGDLAAFGEVTLNGGSDVDGNIEAGGNVTLNSGNQVNGNINSTGTVTVYGNGEVTGYVNAANINDNAGGVQGPTCNINNNVGPCGAGGGSTLPAAIGHWFMDELIWDGTSGEVLDSSGNERHGTAQNGAETARSTPAIPGNPGTCRYGDFNGSSRFSVANNTAINNLQNFTMGFWVRADATDQNNSDTYQTMVVYGNTPTSQNDGKFEVYRLTQNGDLYFEIRTGNNDVRNVSVEGNDIFDGEWHHITTIFERSNRRLTLIIDGDYDARTTSSFNGNHDLKNVSGGLNVGGQSFGSNSINGQMDELYLSDVILSEQEISVLYVTTRPCVVTLPNATLDFQFNDGPWTAGLANDVEDSSGNNFNGTALGGVTAGSSSDAPALPNDGSGFGSCGYAEFDGSNNQSIRIDHNNELDLTSEYTFAMWVNPATIPNSGSVTLIDKGSNYRVELLSNGALRWRWRIPVWWWTIERVVETPANTLSAGSWTHIALRRQSTQQTIFVNGQIVTTATNTGTPVTNNDDLYIGYNPTDNNSYYSGALDQFQLFDSALADTEIEALTDQRSLCDDVVLQCYTDALDDGTVFGQTWTSSATSGSFIPTIVNGRVRLTENVTNQATRITLNQTFPAANNRVILEFSLFAYGGSGADGIALVFSDATVPPQAGGYGGSLGYAQLNLGGTFTPGFAGGWLGIGFDEYGNFSKNNEGRQGGFGGQLRPDRVVLRGAEANNYPYLKDSGQLSPGVDQPGNSPGPEHKYRIIIDSTVPNTSIISVERDTGTGYQYIIVPFDVFDEFPGQQPVVPEDFLVSFTGSTGGSTNIHEFDDIQVCAIDTDSLNSEIDHFRLTHQGETIACLATPIEVQACLDANCDNLYTGPTEVVLSTTEGTYAGGNVLTYNSSSGTKFLRNTAGGIATVGVLTSDPLPDPGFETKCFVAGVETSCDINFKNAGLLFTDTDQLSPIANQISGESFNGVIRAVETNTLTGACEARLSGAQEVQIGYECRNPTSCIAGQSMSVNGTSVGANNLNNASNTAAVNVVFDSNGNAPITLAYTDAGQVRLHGQINIDQSNPDPAFQLTGNSNNFVVKPHTLVVSNAASGAITNPETTNSGSGFIAAGENFQLFLEARNSFGAATPNFGNELSPETVTAALDSLVYPSGGNLGTLSTTAPFVADAGNPGRFVSNQISYNEVGSIRIRGALTDNDYLGAGDIPNKPPSPTIGRFYPSYLQLQSSTLSNSCSAFTYMGNPGILLDSTLVARGAGGNVVLNYDNNDLDYAGTATFALAAKSGTSYGLGSRFSSITNDGVWNDGVYVLTSSALQFARVGTVDGPFHILEAGIRVNTEIDSRGLIGTDFDETQSGCSGVSCNAVQLNGTLDVRYGRLVVENTFGPEDANLPVNLYAEYWNGSNFIANSDDNCTSVFPVSLSVTDDPEGLGSVPGGISSTLGSGMLAPNAMFWQPSTNLAPDNVGEFEFEYQAPPWLQFNWEDSDGVNYLNPRGTAGFGQFRGNDRIIYQRELGW